MRRFFDTNQACRLSLVSIALVISTSVVAQTQRDMSQDACRAFQQTDRDLNEVYRRILDEYASQPPFLDRLRASQRAWIVFRDAHVEAIFPEADKLEAYGSAYALCRCAVLADLTARRVNDLRQWLTGAKEGDVCRGSMRIRNR